VPDHISTTIDGLTVLRNRAIGDARGWLGELLPGGSTHPALRDGFGNLYLSVAVGSGVARAGHYHHRQSEVFFTLTGTALWAFRDYRAGGPTRGATYVVLFSDGEAPIGPAPAYRVGGDVMPGIVVPRGVYHVYWALGETPVRVACVATTPHDDSDYVRLAPRDVPGVPEAVAAYGLAL
jgi:dTDP-4-dehydrorhamnose 3,5-epimerase